MYVGGTVVLIREYNLSPFEDSATREDHFIFWRLRFIHGRPCTLDVFDTFDLSRVAPGLRRESHLADLRNGLE